MRFYCVRERVLRASLATLFLLCTLFTTAGSSFGQSPTPTLQRFAVVYTLGPKWIKGVPVFKQNLRDHANFEAKLLAEGKLLFGGPFDDSTGGLAVLQLPSEADAIELEKHDPAFTEGVLIPHVHKWDVFFEKKSN